MMQAAPLKRLIAERYKSEAQAAKALGWSRQRLNRITNGKKEPDLDEVNALAKLLKKPLGEIAAIFLSKKSPNEQHQ